ncbi:hypothetical protein L3Q82_008320 [Scortum barcoo]|uniref:Uncharacterized protein n=1 Tax=Scortum barcoo TaxID=214431 RepID=A0ACB8WHM8_9TELE|nr:hypothetical protein L3Q82_008320 [Scortum barcoo]
MAAELGSYKQAHTSSPPLTLGNSRVEGPAPSRSWVPEPWQAMRGGYGNLSPSTVSGQVFCVFYALCGIPLNLAFLKQLGKCLTIHLGRLERGMVSVVPHKQTVEALSVGLFFITGSLLFLVIPPLLFSYVEGWTFGEGFYFAFITLSTIGFGDYVVGSDPGKEYISLYRSLAGIWIIFALAWLALILNIGARITEHAIGLTHPGFKKQEEEEDVSSSKLEDMSKGAKMGIKEMFNLAWVPSILMLGVVYMAYVLIGGVVFWKLEGDLGQKDISLLLLKKERLLTTYTCLNQDGLEMVAQFFLPPQRDHMVTAHSFAGYGNMSPRTTAGQIFCVFFALFGIPLNMVVLNRVGKYMLAIERNISDFLEGKTRRRRCTRFFVHLVSYLSGVALFFVVPMLVFQLYEGWTYSQAIYYCFITLSTIGFGDFVAVSLFFTDSNPNKQYPDWYSFLMASWIFFGMAWLALLINHSIDILERLNTHLKQWRGGQKKEEDPGSAETDNPETQVEEEDEVKGPPVTETRAAVLAYMFMLATEQRAKMSICLITLHT